MKNSRRKTAVRRFTSALLFKKPLSLTVCADNGRGFVFLINVVLVFPVCSPPVSHAESQDEVKEDSEEKKTDDVSRQGTQGKPQSSPANIFLRRHFPKSRRTLVFSNHN